MRRHGEALAGADVERDALPPPRIDAEPDGGEGLDLRIGGDAALLAIAAELSAHDVAGLERGDGLQDFHLLVAQRLAVHPRRRLHREVAQHLEQVVLDDVADRAGRVVEAAAALDAEVLRHRDLHALDVGAIPERLEDRIREADEQHVVNGPLAEVMVDPEDVALDERAEQDPIQLARRGEVLAEWLLDDDAGALRAARSRQLLDDGSEQRRRDREVVRGMCARRQARAGAPRTSPGPGSRRRHSAAVRTACRTPSRSRPPCFSTLSCARARNWSSVQPALATPMTGTSSWPRLAMACSAGKIFLYARSPVAPKNTSASERVSAIAVSHRHFVVGFQIFNLLPPFNPPPPL